jgi:trans-2,3-dihydro-3-hydroxyanthranilate isomerase
VRAAIPVLITIVDACLRDGRGGSPTAVAWEQPLTVPERCAIPRRTGTSHVAFIAAGGERHGPPQASLRFFTATGELPACGHGTVAALAILAETSPAGAYRGVLSAGGRTFAGQAGPDGDDLGAAFDPGPVALREATAEERRLTVEALGDGTLAAGVCVASVGRARLLVPVAGEAELAALHPDQERLRSGCERLGLLGCYVYSPPMAGGRLSARMFAPAIGVPEDIANANSTGCLAARLAGQGITELRVDMGDALGRPATITATAHPAGGGVEVRVGGSARVARTLELEPAPAGRSPGPTTWNSMP